MTLIGKNGKEYEVRNAYVIERNEKLVIEMDDNRPIYVIAAEFENVDIFHVDNTLMEKSYDFDGYTKMTRIVQNKGSVYMHLIRQQAS